METPKSINIEWTDNVVRLYKIKATEAIDYKYELIRAGLVLDVDFQWVWYTPTEDATSKVEFIFKNPAHATLYKLKWE